MNEPARTARLWPFGSIRDPWLFWVALVAQLAATKVFLRVSPTGVAWLLMLSYVPLLAGVTRNWRWWGIRLIAVGAVMNLIVMMVNGGFMPVSPEAALRAGLGQRIAGVQPGEYISGTKGVVQAEPQIHLRWLSDTVAVPAIGRVLSPGDLAIVLGFLAFLVELLRSRLLVKVRPGEGSRRGDLTARLQS